MSDGFEVDADRLGRHAGEFEALAERAARVAEELRRALDATGEPWGADAVGRSFAAAHAEPAAGALDRLRRLPDDLAGVGERFTAAAAAYRAGDERAVSDVTDAGRTR
ncbi:excreted virulence factor EspC (type VII ESX diderm) [Prauserella shujinwangii]|uniref:Excreted virulence factor EspC (Type VII ESX diderm) n=2 Tax=Prauserella shujinwangii TaxID=1453103 RepID=A0A2T0LML9_9PSEU|nr:excreted virulence factor EspC (type VII ESX diderm) [Prauserella shujinwangii]